MPASNGPQSRGNSRQASSQGASRDREGTDEGEFRSSFQRLLQLLDQQHEREVLHLRDEIKLLQRVNRQSREDMSRNSYMLPADIGTEQPPPPVRSYAGLPPVPRKGPLFAQSLDALMYADSEKPDEDALTAALNLATGIHADEEMVSEVTDILAKDVYCPTPTATPRVQAGNNQSSETASLLTGEADIRDERWWQNQDHRESRWKPNGNDVESRQELSKIRLQAAPVYDSQGDASNGQDGVKSYSVRNVSEMYMEDEVSRISETPIPPEEGWRRLIEHVQRHQALDALPKLSPVWKADRSQGTSGVLDLKSVISKVTKENPRTTSSRTEVVKPVRRDWYIVRLMQPFMMHPTCRRRVIWDCGGIILLLHDLIFIPMQVFQTGTEGLPKFYEKIQSVLDNISAVFWTTDILVSFLTGFYSSEGFVELYPPRVARHYMKGWLSMDLLIVSADWSTMYLGMSSASGYMRLGKTVSRFMRVLRLLRFLKMNTTMKELMERINSEYVLQLVNLLKTLVFIVVINHYIACTWYALGASGWFSSRWPDKHLVNYPQSFGYAYTTSLHWSLTQFTPASMEVVPQNELERFFTIMVIIMALVAFSSFVSSITAAMTHIRQIKAKQLEEEAKIRQFFSEHKISHGMASRVWHFMRKNKGVGAKRLKESDVPALKSLPGRIKEDLRVEIYLPILREHPFLQNYQMREDGAIFKICNQAINERSLLSGEELFPPGVDIRMFFVAGGQCCYTEKVDVDRTCGSEQREFLVRRGNWACEVAAWADKAVLEGPFIAHAGPADVIMIMTEMFQNILLSFDNSVTFLIKYAERFMERFVEVSNAELGREEDDVNVLFNDPEMIADLVRACEETHPVRRSRPRDIFMFASVGRGSGPLSGLTRGSLSKPSPRITQSQPLAINHGGSL